MRSRTKRSVQENPWFYVAPGLVIVGCLTAIPMVYGIYLSFTNWSIISSPTPHLEGITAYQKVLADPDTWANLMRTVWWTLGTLAIEVVVALPLAMLLNHRTKVTGFVTGAIMIPWITPFVVLSYAWLYLYDGMSGPLHHLLEWIGLVGSSSPLSDPAASLWSITIISGWKGIPFLTIAMLAARKNIPDDLYEAAAIDGTDGFGAFRHITLPMLMPTLGAMCVVLGVQAFYSFDLVWILTQGGPGTTSTILGVQLFETFFKQGLPGEAAALGTLMLVLMVILVVPILKLSSRRVNQ